MTKTETKETPDPNEPAKETPDPKPNPATPPAMTPEQLESLNAAARNWEAVKGMYRQREDGTLELDPSALPPVPGSRRTTDDLTEEERIAAEEDARRRGNIADEVTRASAAHAEKIQADLELQQKLQEELAEEPGGKEIFEQARAAMKRLPVDKRSEKAWRNAIQMGRGLTEKSRRQHWIDEGKRQALEDMEKAHGIRIPKPAAKPKTDDDLAAELTPAQKREADRRGLDHKTYAKRLAELRGGPR
jgi:hypothetical protein